MYMLEGLLPVKYGEYSISSNVCVYTHEKQLSFVFISLSLSGCIRQFQSFIFDSHETRRGLPEPIRFLLPIDTHSRARDEREQAHTHTHVACSRSPPPLYQFDIEQFPIIKT